MLRRAANAWENTIKTQPAANANTIISPRQSTLYGKKNSHQNAVKCFIIYEKDGNGLLFHTCIRKWVVIFAVETPVPSPSSEKNPKKRKGDLWDSISTPTVDTKLITMSALKNLCV